jgi:hypothetical protein
MAAILESLSQGRLTDAGLAATKLIKSFSHATPSDLAELLYLTTLVSAGFVSGARRYVAVYLSSNPTRDHRFFLINGQNEIDAGNVENGLSQIQRSTALAPATARLSHINYEGCTGCRLRLRHLMEESIYDALSESRRRGIDTPLRTLLTRAQYVAMTSGAQDGLEDLLDVRRRLKSDPWGHLKLLIISARLKFQAAVSGKHLDMELVRGAHHDYAGAANIHVQIGVSPELEFDGLVNAAHRDYISHLSVAGLEPLLTAIAIDDNGNPHYDDGADEFDAAEFDDILKFLEEPYSWNADTALFRYGRILESDRISAAEKAYLREKVVEGLRPNDGDANHRRAVGPYCAQFMAWEARRLEFDGNPECLRVYREAASLSENNPHVRGCILNDLQRALRRSGLASAAADVAVLRDHDWSRVVLPMMFTYDDTLLCDVRPRNALRAMLPATTFTSGHAAVFSRKRLHDEVKLILAGRTSSLPHLDGGTIWKVDPSLSQAENLRNLDIGLVKTFQAVQPSLSSHVMAKWIDISSSTILRVNAAIRSQA